MSDLLKGANLKPTDVRATVANLRVLADDLEAMCNRALAPTPEAFIDNWIVHRRAGWCLAGRCEDHPILKGPHVTTTELIFLNQAAGLARTHNRWYRLGTPHDLGGASL